MKKQMNGYSDSIMTTEQGVCYVCRIQGETARHELFYGTANRKKSKEWGTWINVCPRCHALIHARPQDFVYLKVAGQRQFVYNFGQKLFMETFGKNYLDEWE